MMSIRHCGLSNLGSACTCIMWFCCVVNYDWRYVKTGISSYDWLCASLSTFGFTMGTSLYLWMNLEYWCPYRVSQRNYWTNGTKWLNPVLPFTKSYFDLIIMYIVTRVKQLHSSLYLFYTRHFEPLLLWLTTWSL